MWRVLWFVALVIPTSRGGTPYIVPTVGRPFPLPQVEHYSVGSVAINVYEFSFLSGIYDCDILQNAYKRYANILETQASVNAVGRVSFKFEKTPNDYIATLNVSVASLCEGAYPDVNMSEKYELNILRSGLTLMADSVWGALRGLETFSQLGVATGDGSTLVFDNTRIVDFPRFSHRGVLLDTSRHYLPVSKIKENLDLMAMNKFNVFHWHIVDDQSFPYQSAVYPDLSGLGSWSSIHIYTSADVASVVEYGRQLGIRVMSEFDTPGHTLSWGPGQPGLLTECYGPFGNPDGSFGPIDPSVEENFQFLETLFTEISDRFRDHYLHLGGDEVDFSCWRSSPTINDFMAERNISGDYKQLEAYYITRLIDIISHLPNKKGYMVWQEVFDNGVVLDEDAVVHIWKGTDPSYFNKELVKVTTAGFQALLSACWYLSTITYGSDWNQFYNCDPQDFNGTDDQKRLVLGGEACMWGEYVDETNLTPRLWPRASAVAERLWSSQEETTDAGAAAPRLEEHRCRLFLRGYAVESLGPSYCQGVL